MFKKTNRLMFSTHQGVGLLIGIGLLIVISTVAVIFPPELQEKANPLVTPAHIKPEWYFFFTFRWLKLTGLLTAVITLGLATAAFVFWPLIEPPINRFFKRDVSIPVGILVVIGILVLTLWESLAV